MSSLFDIKIQPEDAYLALKLLAARKGYNSWCTAAWNFEDTEWDFTCLICENIITRPLIDKFSSLTASEKGYVQKHGLQHLKDIGLLAFL